MPRNKKAAEEPDSFWVSYSDFIEQSTDSSYRESKCPPWMKLIDKIKKIMKVRNFIS